MANYPQIAPNSFINLMTKIYASDKEIFEAQPTKMLWGQPGIGKSQAVKQFAEKLQEETGKTVNTKIVSLLLMNPIDLRGIPAKSKDENDEDVAKWLTPEIFKMDPSDDVINILFLDEISAAPPSVQAAAYQICLDKRVGEHVLPKNTIVICAGNRTSDKAVAYQMPKPLANRLTHFEMVADLDSWKEWAYKEGIDPNIIGFITWRPDYLNKFDPSTDDVAFPTPRSWELVNSYMKIDFDTMFDAISGTVGLETATEFKVFMNFNHKIPQFEDIKAGTADKPNEKDAGLMYALASHIISNVIAEHKDLKEKEKDNIFSYITSFKHDEYIVLIMQDIIKNCKEIIPYLLNNKEIRKFIKNVSDMLA